MACALAADRDLVGKLGPEQDQGFGVEPAVLDEAEATERRHRRARSRRRGLAGRRKRIGEPRAVHVEAEAALSRDLAQRSDFGRAIDEPVFGRIGDRERRGLNLVHVVADAIAGVGDSCGMIFAP